jgi:tetratricopeptide (TPR) repeat protein
MKPDNAPTVSLARAGALRAFFLLSLLIAAAYGNSLNAIWTIDDDPNILQNTRLHIGDLTVPTLFQTLFSPLHPDKSGNPGLNRPLAHLSFALNWYFGKDSPVGYRLINILIHFLTAFFLYSTVRKLLDSPNLRNRFAGSRDGIALLGATLWAVNPIQTQTVVYIVQRMAGLACFFYLLGIWCYLRARFSEGRAGRVFYLLLTLASYVAGMSSKENAVMLPASLALMEIAFFQDLSQTAVRRRILMVLAASLGLLLAAAGLLIWQGKADALPGYGVRLFSPWERLMTEPRVVLFYLSQIFYPAPGRLSIVHDVEISRSLFAPWTTLPAILAVLVLVGFGCAQLRKRPMLGFSVLFFLLNHIVESSFIGLELIYEHRNYLPSLFLFAPVAMEIHAVADRCRSRAFAFQKVLVGAAILMVVGLTAGTHIRNLAWLDHKTFWEDAALKAPLSMRPVHNLAYYHYEKNGEHEKAFELYHKALALEDNNRLILSFTHIKIAEHHEQRGDFEKAADHLDKALSIFPGFEVVQYRLAQVLARTSNPERALAMISPLVAKHPDSFDCNYLMAQILLRNGRSKDALRHLQHCLRLSPDSVEAVFMAGIALNLAGHWEAAERFMRAVLDRKPGDKQALLWMIDSQLRQSDETAAAESAVKFLAGMAADRVDRTVEALDDNFMAEDSRVRLGRWIAMQAK